MEVECSRPDCSVSVRIAPGAGAQVKITYSPALEMGCPLRRPKVGQTVPLLVEPYSCPNLDAAIQEARTR